MRKLAYIFCIALFLFGCGGIPMDIRSVLNNTKGESRKNNAKQIVQKINTPKKPIKFCDSGIILPIDCTEADKNSREIWFKFKYFNFDVRQDCPLLDFSSTEATVMRNGNLLVSYPIGRQKKHG